MRPALLSLLLICSCACGREPTTVQAAGSSRFVREALAEVESLDAPSLRLRIAEFSGQAAEKRQAFQELELLHQAMQNDPTRQASDSGKALNTDYIRLRAELSETESVLQVYQAALADRHP